MTLLLHSEKLERTGKGEKSTEHGRPSNVSAARAHCLQHAFSTYANLLASEMLALEAGLAVEDHFFVLNRLQQNPVPAAAPAEARSAS
jgi:hypothetical protein